MTEVNTYLNCHKIPKGVKTMSLKMLNKLVMHLFVQITGRLLFGYEEIQLI